MILLGFIVAQIIIFAVILFLLKRLIFQDTDSAISRLTRLDNLNRDKEKKLGEKLDETDRLLREKMAQLAEEEKRLRMEAERAANKLHDDIVKKARGEGETLLKKAYAAKAKLEADATIKAESKILDICVEIMREILGPMSERGVNKALIDEFIVELEKMETDMVANVKRIDINTGVKTDEETISQIKAILEKKLGREVTLKVKEDAALIAGIQMKFGTLVVDDSMLERIQTTTKKIRADMARKNKEHIK